jgi:hypothetical protein
MRANIAVISLSLFVLSCGDAVLARGSGGGHGGAGHGGGAHVHIGSAGIHRGGGHVHIGGAGIHAIHVARAGIPYRIGSLHGGYRPHFPHYPLNIDYLDDTNYATIASSVPHVEVRNYSWSSTMLYNHPVYRGHSGFILRR